MSSLLYTDDIVILAPDEDKLEKLISVGESWCTGWNMVLNISKTIIDHFKKKRGNKPRSTHIFAYNKRQITFSNT